MAITVSATISAGLAAALEKTENGGVDKFTLNMNASVRLPSSRISGAVRIDGDTIGKTTYDLESIVGPDGETITFTEVHALIIKNKTTDGTLTVEPGDSTPWSGLITSAAGTGIKVPPGGTVMVGVNAGTGWAVSDTSKDIEINTATSADYEMLIVGKA